MPTDTAPDVFVRYVQAWVDRSPDVLPKVLSPNIHYRESHGPAYRGLDQVQRWFADWNKRGQVLAWDITDHVGAGRTHVCRWRFRCVYDGNDSTFDGATWFELDSDGRIEALWEFAATLPHRYPYDEP